MAAVDATFGVAMGVRRCLGTRAAGTLLRRAANGRTPLRRPVGQFLIFASAEEDVGPVSTMSRTALRKLKKAELARQLLKCGLDSEGTKPQLVDRLWVHFSNVGKSDTVSLEKKGKEAKELSGLYKSQLVKICRSSGLPTGGTKATLVTRILNHREHTRRPDRQAVPTEALGMADSQLEQQDTLELVTEEEYDAQREEIRTELLQMTKVQLQQMCLAKGLKKNARSKLELAERILEALDDYANNEAQEESKLKAANDTSEATSQIEAPLGALLEDTKETARIKNFTDNTDGLASEIDTILDEMRKTYGKYLPTDGLPQAGVPFSAAGMDTLKEPTDDDLRALENEVELREYSSSEYGLLKQDSAGVEDELATPSVEEEGELAEAAAQSSQDMTSTRENDTRSEVTICLDDDKNGTADDELGSEGYEVVSGEVVLPDMKGASAEEEGRRLEAKPLDLSGVDEGNGTDLQPLSPTGALEPAESAGSSSGGDTLIGTEACGSPSEESDIGVPSTDGGAAVGVEEDGDAYSIPSVKTEPDASEPDGEPMNGDILYGAPTPAATVEEVPAATQPVAGTSDAPTLEDGAPQGSKLIGAIREEVEARKAALARMQERIGAAESSQEYNTAQMERLLEIAEDLKAQRSDWQNRMQGKVESLQEVAERIHETEKTKAALATDLSQLEDQLEGLENDAEEKSKEAKELKVAICSQSPDEEDAPQSTEATKGNASKGKMSPAVAMATGMLGFVDMLSRVLQDAKKQEPKEKRRK